MIELSLLAKRGVDWERIRELARAQGLPAQSERDLLQRCSPTV
jgi:hypothetical protein